jgi:hypothetical protein
MVSLDMENTAIKPRQISDNPINRKDFLVDLQIDYVTYFPADLGFAVGFLPRDFAADGLSPNDFVAEVVHWPAWGEIPGHAELVRLSRIAAHLFAVRFLAHLEKQAADDFQHHSVSEDSTHVQETDIATV